VLKRIKSKTDLFFLFSVLIGIAVFFKNAWVSEDAYILFRSLEQVLVGNGPVWNPHERVQVFTSPLWFLILIFPRIISPDNYLNVLIVSLIIWIAIIYILKLLFNNNKILLLSILLFTSSSAFFDYTSSGLENILAYFIITLYFNYYFGFSELKKEQESQEINIKPIKACLILFGLLILVRHDLILILLIPTLYIIYQNPANISPLQWTKLILLALSPFIIFTLFSILYYGFPFPNTAYAKLNTGIAEFTMIKQGVKYLISSLKFDLITILVMIASVLITIKDKNNYHKAIGLSLILNLLYIIYIGGDFMRGRFLSYAFLTATLTVLYTQRKLFSDHTYQIGFVLLILYIILYPHTPFNSPYDYTNKEVSRGIADERGYYFKRLSVHTYISQLDERMRFPQRLCSLEGEAFRDSPDLLIVKDNVGIFGYCSGTDKIIIDLWAITDPLLSRLPVTGRWRIGHFSREVPAGYIESILYDGGSLDDPAIDHLYTRIKLITQSPKIFSKERLQEIILFNLGY